MQRNKKYLNESVNLLEVNSLKEVTSAPKHQVQKLNSARDTGRQLSTMETTVF